MTGSFRREERGSIPGEQADVPVLDMESLTVTLVADRSYGGLHISKWVNDGLEPGTHRLIPACLAEREVRRLEAIKHTLNAASRRHGDQELGEAVLCLDEVLASLAARVPRGSGSREIERLDQYVADASTVYDRKIREAERDRIVKRRSPMATGEAGWRSFALCMIDTMRLAGTINPATIERCQSVADRLDGRPAGETDPNKWNMGELR